MKVSFAHLEKARVSSEDHPSKEGDRSGMFVMFIDPKTAVHMISDCGSMSGWETVIINITRKEEDGKFSPMLPDFRLVEHIKEMFWDGNETVVIYFDENVPSPLKGSPVILFKSKRQTYILPPFQLITPDSKPDNVIPLPQPSEEAGSPTAAPEREETASQNPSGSEPSPE